MKEASLNWIRLPLKNAGNTRELGGYPTRDGGQTKWHAFLRSDDLHALDEEDMRFLREYGVKTVVDLRSQKEGEIHRNPFEGTPVVCRRVSLIGEALGGIKIADLTKADLERIEIEPAQFYIMLLEGKERIKELFEIIWRAPEGCILFHCHAGKDRTGVLSMLLLGLAGVEKQDIMANYEVSFVYNTRGENSGREGTDPYPKLLLSRPEFIGEAYDYVIKSYGGVESYLLTAGLAAEAVEQVRRRIRD